MSTSALESSRRSSTSPDAYCLPLAETRRPAGFGVLGGSRRRASVRDSPEEATAANARPAGHPASRPVRGARGWCARGRGRLEASSVAGDACASERPCGRRRRPRRRPLGGRAARRSAERAPSSRRPPSRRARREVDRRLARRLRAERRARGRAAVRGAARGDARCVARGRRPVRGGHGRAGAGPLARPGAAGPAPDGVVQRRGTPARGAARGRARGALRGHARARRASGARAGTPVGARGQPLPGAAVGAADAGALSQRPAGRRAGDVPGGAARARRGAGTRAGTRAPPAPGGDPRARSRDRRRPGRAQAPRQPPRNLDVVRRPGGGARPGRRLRARAPSRHAHRAAGGREEPARARDGALARDEFLDGIGSSTCAGGRRRRRRRPAPASPSTFAVRSARARGLAASARPRARRSRRVRARTRRGGRSCRRSSPTVARSGS